MTTDLHEADLAAAGSPAKRAYVKRMFSEIAPRYDLLNHVLSLNVDRRWRRIALGRLGWEGAPAGTYLDLCAGTLDVAATLSRTTGFRGHVIGADFAEPMLRAGRGKAPRDLVSPAVADTLALPFADACASGAIVAFGMRNLADVDAGMREIARVLRPGGRLVILEFTTPRSRLMRVAFGAYFRRVLPAIGALVSGHGTAYRYLPASVGHFPPEGELAARMVAAGFRQVAWETVSFGIAAIHVGTRA